MGCLPIDDLIVDSIKSVRPFVLVRGGVVSALYPNGAFISENKEPIINIGNIEIL